MECLPLIWPTTTRVILNTPYESFMRRERSQQKPRHRIAFLTYMSRSGSTFLAQEIDSIRGVYVGIEARFQDGWIRGPQVILNNEAELNRYLETLYEDPKFRAWGISAASLKERLTALSFPLRFSDVLIASLKEYIKDPEPTAIVHKCGHYILCAKQIRSELPDALIIFLDRDPRSIYASQKNSRSSQDGAQFQTDIDDFVLQYRAIQSAVDALVLAPYVMSVSFEEIVSGGLQSVLSAIAEFMGADGNHRKETSYFNAIPEAQKHLHTNVGRRVPDPNRINAWQDKLSAAEIAFLERALNRYFKKKGYSRSKVLKINGYSEYRELIEYEARYFYERVRRHPLIVRIFPQKQPRRLL